VRKQGRGSTLAAKKKRQRRNPLEINMKHKKLATLPKFQKSVPASEEDSEFEMFMLSPERTTEAAKTTLNAYFDSPNLDLLVPSLPVEGSIGGEEAELEAQLNQQIEELNLFKAQLRETIELDAAPKKKKKKRKK